MNGNPYNRLPPTALADDFYPRFLHRAFPFSHGLNPGWEQAPAQMVDTPEGQAWRMIPHAVRTEGVTPWRRFNYPNPWTAPRVQSPMGPEGLRPVFPRSPWARNRY